MKLWIWIKNVVAYSYKSYWWRAILPFFVYIYFSFEVCHVGGEEDSKIEKFENFNFRIINTIYISFLNFGKIYNKKIRENIIFISLYWFHALIFEAIQKKTNQLE